MNARRLLVINVIVIFLLIILGFVGYFMYNRSTLYLSTDNAQVAGQQIAIVPPTTGKIENWNANQGTQFQSGEKLGTLDMSNGKTMDITMPSDGTIVQSSAMNNEYVVPGTPIAYAYNLSQLYVTANIKETQINDVKVGQDVDVYVDAYPGTTVKGTVQSLGNATAATFSMSPTSSSNTANFTKVTQVIPVKIQLSDDQGIGLIPGESCTVRIHK